MSKDEFLTALSARLSHFPAAEAEKSRAFYAESIEDRMEDGMTEAAAVADLGDLDAIVHEIELTLPLGVLVKNKWTSKRDMSQNRTLWMVLAICGSPFWLPIALALAAVALTVYLVIWVAVVVLYVLLIALAACGAVGILGSIVSLLRAEPLQGGLILGAAVTSAGLFLLCSRPMVWLTKRLAACSVWLVKKIKSGFVSGKKAA